MAITPEERATALLEKTGILSMPKTCTASLRYALPHAIREAENAKLEEAAVRVTPAFGDAAAIAIRSLITKD